MFQERDKYVCSVPLVPYLEYIFGLAGPNKPGVESHPCLCQWPHTDPPALPQVMFVLYLNSRHPPVLQDRLCLVKRSNDNLSSSKNLEQPSICWYLSTPLICSMHIVALLHYCFTENSPRNPPFFWISLNNTFLEGTWAFLNCSFFQISNILVFLPHNRYFLHLR